MFQKELRMASDCPFSGPSQTYGFWLSFLSPSQSYGFWLFFLKFFSNLWLPYVSEGLKKGQSEAISLRRTWKGTTRSHKFEKDLRRDTHYGFWLSLLMSFSNLWLLIVPCQVLLKRMASDCPLSSPSQTYGFWLSLLKFFSTLWLLVVIWEGLKKGQSEAISLRRTWEGTIRSHKF
jgi:hypothetical protein